MTIALFLHRKHSSGKFIPPPRNRVKQRDPVNRPNFNLEDEIKPTVNQNKIKKPKNEFRSCRQKSYDESFQTYLFSFD